MPLFSQTSDLELWVVHDMDGALPAYVRPGLTPRDGKPAWLIFPAMSLKSDQLRWWDTRMESITRAKWDGQWLARPEAARRCMRKALGVTPAYYVQWGQSLLKEVKGVVVNGHDADPGGELEDMSSSADAFVRYTANYAGIGNLSNARYLWLQFCRCAVNWMMIEGKPLDMMFARLHAFPLRANWLAVMAAKFPNYMQIAQLPPEERQKRLDGTTFSWLLEQPDMASMFSSMHVDWTVNVELREDWYRHTRKHEMDQVNALGPAGYYQRWLKMVRRSFAYLSSTFHEYCLSSSWASGDIDQSLPLHSRFLRWVLKPGLVRPAVAPIPKVAHTFGEAAPNPEDRKREPAFQTFGGLPELPDEDIEKRLLDLWKPGGMDGQR